jgi:hypothetical protein
MLVDTGLEHTHVRPFSLLGLTVALLADEHDVMADSVRTE